ncbi:MAG TPA: glycosyltransferase family 1 protein [Bacteroidales bacterium]|nr:glycosyltransferase family 1 protein [Bacteroidales bacterium]
MNIAVNTRLLLDKRLEGIGWFSFETLKRVVMQHPEHTFYFIFDRPYHKKFVFSDNVIPVVTGPQARHPLLFYIWFEFSIPKILKKIKADIFISPDGYASLRSKVPNLLVMHDLNFEHYPDDLPWIITKYYTYFFPRFAKKAARIATVSEFSKKDIHECYGYPENKIDVIYNGVNENYHPISDEEKMATKKKYTSGCDYFIYIGALLPRKNLKNLFLAYDLFRKQNKSTIKLLIVGARMWWTPEMEATINSLEYKNDIIFTGRLNSDELNNALGAALALTYVSYFEGFGIPLLEAFRCDVPVITSDVTSLPEVAGDAALYTDPFNPISISEAMRQAASDEHLRESLISKARERRNFFSWDRTAELFWQSIQKTVSK